MPDISKINALAIGSVGKVDGLAKASILDIDGVAVPSAAAFLLDTYTGSTFGYSLRRLAAASTVLIRVRRDTTGGTGDDDEADVAYDSNNELSLDSAISNASAGVTATTLGEFINVGKVGGTTYSNPDSLTVTAICTVDTIYDQSTNGYDLDQATHASQPIIHDGTSNTDIIQENGRPTMDMTGNRYLERIATAIPLSQTELAVFTTGTSTAKYVTVGGRSTIYGFTGTSLEIFQNPRFTLSSSPPSSLLVSSFNLTSTTYEGFVNGTAGDSGTGTFSQGNYQRMGQTFNGVFSEWLCWQNQTTNRTGIEENINSDYLIYQPTDAPTSGLLATYTGAAAAYSVRQLSDKAVIAMRIRRDSDDEERNIGWDANGDLDTTAISDFCGTANGYVSRWWDQSTNGNHADQATDTSQPQIYNGTAVITGTSGKPALQEVSNSGFSSFTAGTNPWTVVAVIEDITRSTGGFTNAFYGLQRLQANQGDADLILRISSNEFVTAVDNDTSSVIWQLDTSTGISTYAVNGSTTSTASIGNANFSSTIGRPGFAPMLEYIHEIILWPSELDAFSGVFTDLDNYYTIS